MRIKARTVLIGTLMIAATVGTAYIIGVQAGNMAVGDKTKRFRTRRDLKTKKILSEMENLAIGDTLPDHYFYDLELNLRQLSDVTTGLTVLSFVDPTCGACLDQSLMMQEMLKSPMEYGRFISISSTNALLLKEYQQEYGFEGLILYDENKEFQNALGVAQAPFNLFVDNELVVHKVVVGPLTADEVESVVNQDANIR